MAKRLFDVSITLVVAPVAAAIVAVFAVILAFDLRGNPFFVQTRIGKRERPFRMYKLRTMRAATPGEQKSYAVEDWQTYVFSPPGERDPRITRWGAIARKTSIDELPNLVNVLKGEMSIVGPRPEIPELVAQYPPAYRRRHLVAPGIAGLAQAGGRSDLTYDEIMRLDLQYVDHHSVLTDLRILARTVATVLTGSGAR
jgi:lipopolysaccharide/colanic/teichoic acid biosynthesis glycosyltransferase